MKLAIINYHYFEYEQIKSQGNGLTLTPKICFDDLNTLIEMSKKHYRKEELLIIYSYIE